MTLKLPAGAVASIMPAGAAAVAGGQQTSDATAAQEFSSAAAAYDAVHQKLAWRIPVQVRTDPEQLVAGSTALADAIRSARPAARRRDLFTADVSAMFRDRIRRALTSSEVIAAALIAELTREAPAAPLDLIVNSRFDSRYGALMPALLTAVLPQLPDSLQYRIVGADLVLIDVDANLIVDRLPGALAVE